MGGQYTYWHGNLSVHIYIVPNKESKSNPSVNVRFKKDCWKPKLVGEVTRNCIGRYKYSLDSVYVPGFVKKQTNKAFKEAVKALNDAIELRKEELKREFYSGDSEFSKLITNKDN